MNKEFLISCNICGHFCLAGRPCYDIFTAGFPRDWEELRLSWIKDLLRMSKSMWDYKIIAKNFPQPPPQWFERAISKGESPLEEMQTDLLDILQQN